MKRALASILPLLSSACGYLGNPGTPPPLSAMTGPVQDFDPAAAALDRIPRPDQQQVYLPSANSLWRPGARSFFDDQRASNIGDILTVNIAIADRAQVKNSTSRQRSGDEKVSVDALLGLEKALPTSSPAIGFGSASNNSGTGSVNRAETIDLTVAAVIVDKLENGNMVISGSQEVRINNEVRELLVSGIIRAQDIASDNTVRHTQIAQARISYGGRGDLSVIQRSRYGKRIYDKLAPF